MDRGHARPLRTGPRPLSDDSRIRPVNVEPFPNGEIGIVWGDGHESYWTSRALRCACRCAACVDEATGVKTLSDDSVPDWVRPLAIVPVGRYGINVRWSDGHATGIYAFERLRDACPCAACAAAR